MKKKFTKEDLRDSGVEDLIPEDVWERMGATPGFKRNYIWKSAKSHLKRVFKKDKLKGDAWGHELKRLYKELLEVKLGQLSHDPALDDKYTLGRFLEMAFIIRILDGIFPDPRKNRTESENENTSKTNHISRSRPTLRVVE
jgi:hypothetical protein